MSCVVSSVLSAGWGSPRGFMMSIGGLFMAFRRFLARHPELREVVLALLVTVALGVVALIFVEVVLLG